MTAEARAAQSERMKRMHAEGKMKKKADPAVQEALAKIPITGVADHQFIPTEIPVTSVAHYTNHIHIDVDWDHLPMTDAQASYAVVKKEFEKAGKILNARSMASTNGYTCFQCHKHFNGNPGFTDLSYVNPQTGLSERVDCCGELCVINYHKRRIDMRVAKNIQQAAEERGE